MSIIVFLICNLVWKSAFYFNHSSLSTAGSPFQQFDFQFTFDFSNCLFWSALIKSPFWDKVLYLHGEMKRSEAKTFLRKAVMPQNNSHLRVFEIALIRRLCRCGVTDCITATWPVSVCTTLLFQADYHRLVGHFRAHLHTSVHSVM